MINVGRIIIALIYRPGFMRGSWHSSRLATEAVKYVHNEQLNTYSHFSIQHKSETQNML